MLKVKFLLILSLRGRTVLKFAHFNVTAFHLGIFDLQQKIIDELKALNFEISYLN